MGLLTAPSVSGVCWAIADFAPRRRGCGLNFCDRKLQAVRQPVDSTALSHRARGLRLLAVWRLRPPVIDRAKPNKARCANWCAIISRRSARQPPAYVMGRACRAVVGVYAADGAGAVRFHPRESANDEVDPLMSLIVPLVSPCDSRAHRRGSAKNDFVTKTLYWPRNRS